MKTCEQHGYNPPSRCPNCRIHKRRARKKASTKGWETRRKNEPQNEENHPQPREEFAVHGWLS